MVTALGFRVYGVYGVYRVYRVYRVFGFRAKGLG